MSEIASCAWGFYKILIGNGGTYFKVYLTPQHLCQSTSVKPWQSERTLACDINLAKFLNKQNRFNLNATYGTVVAESYITVAVIVLNISYVSSSKSFHDFPRRNSIYLLNN